MTNQSTKTALFWRLAISAIGIILILMAFGNLLLFVFGETAQASVSTRRYGGERQNAVNEKRYTWYVDYTFEAENGLVYEGHLTKLGSATSVSVDRSIRYFAFAPFINTTEDTATPNAGQLFMLAAGSFCLIVMNKKTRKSNRQKKTDNTSPPDMLMIDDYDDSIENYFHTAADISSYCANCGLPISESARFCPACGGAVSSAFYQQAVEAQRASPQSLVGWTRHHLDPAVLERAAKNKKSAWFFTLFLTVVFPIGFALAGTFLDDMPMDEAIIIGVGLGLLILLIGVVRISRMKAGTWDGTVTDKRQKRKIENVQDDNIARYKTIFTITITDDNGKKHKLNYTDNNAIYNYFNVGERVRCHMAFATFEKFDQSNDRIIYCNICGTQNDLSSECCKSCCLPLFK